MFVLLFYDNRDRICIRISSIRFKILDYGDIIEINGVRYLYSDSYFIGLIDELDNYSNYKNQISHQYMDIKELYEVEFDEQFYKLAFTDYLIR